MDIILTKQCKKELELIKKNQPQYAKLIVQKIQQIVSIKNKHHTKITGYDGLYKARVGGIRIGYSFRENAAIFWMVRKRGEAYSKSNLSKMRSMMK